MESGGGGGPPKDGGSSSNGEWLQKYMDIFSKTRSRLIQAFVKPVLPFPHTPAITTPSVFPGRDGAKGLQSLNHPFQPVSPLPPTSTPNPDEGNASSSEVDNGITVVILEEKVTDLESVMRSLMRGECENISDRDIELAMERWNHDLEAYEIPLPPRPPPGPSDPFLAANNSDVDSPFPNPPKVPDSVYDEIIAIYESHLYNVPPSGSEKCSSSTNTDERSTQSGRKNKEKNLRLEVLKWDKN